MGGRRKRSAVRLGLTAGILAAVGPLAGGSPSAGAEESASGCATATYEYQTVDVPGAGVTQVRDLNDAGQVVGRSGPSLAALSGAEPMQGFVMDLATAQHTAVNVPGAHSTYPEGISAAGVVSGSAGRFDQAGRLLGPTSGFRWSAGVTSTVTFPGLAASTFSYKADSAGTAVGFAVDGTGAPHSYTAASDGTVAEVTVDGATGVYLTAIDDSGRLAGGVSLGGQNHSFVRHTIDSDVKDEIVTVPCGPLTINDLNARGDIAGSYTASDGRIHGVVLTAAGPLTVDYPGAAHTRVYGIDERGEVAGEYLEPGREVPHGFVGLIPRTADLVLTVVDSSNPGFVDESWTEVYTVRNLGPDPAPVTLEVAGSQAVVSDAICVVHRASCRPSYTMSGPADCTDWATLVWECSPVLLPVGGSMTRTFVLTADGSDVIERGATASSPFSDPVPADNRVSFEHITTIRRADLALHATDPPDPVFAGQPTTETYTVTNNGPHGARGVVLQVPGRGGKTEQVTPPEGCTVGTGRLAGYECKIGGLAVGASATFEFSVSRAAPGTYTRTATVSASSEDPSRSNDRAVITTTVKAVPRK